MQASTLGSLEALLEFLKGEKVGIPVSAINIGPVHKRDVMRANVMNERGNKKFGVILAFDVPGESWWREGGGSGSGRGCGRGGAQRARGGEAGRAKGGSGSAACLPGAGPLLPTAHAAPPLLRHSPPASTSALHHHPTHHSRQ